MKGTGRNERNREERKEQGGMKGTGRDERNREG